MGEDEVDEQERAQRRAETATDVAKLMRQPALFRSFARATGQTGGRQVTIIPVLADDRLGYLLDRVREAGNSAVVIMKDETVHVGVVAPASAARIAVAREDDREVPLDDDSSVGVFFDLLEELGSLVSKRLSAKIVDREDLQPSC